MNMKDQEFIDKYRKVYLSSKVPANVSWDDLRIRIAKEEQQQKKLFTLPGSMAFLSLVGIILLAFVGITLSSSNHSPKNTSLQTIENNPTTTPQIQPNNHVEEITATTSAAALKIKPTSSPKPTPTPIPSKNPSDQTGIEKAMSSVIQEIKKIDGQVQGIATTHPDNQDNNKGDDNHNNQGKNGEEHSGKNR
jgi:hypothetical protein